MVASANQRHTDRQSESVRLGIRINDDFEVEGPRRRTIGQRRRHNQVLRYNGAGKGFPADWREGERVVMIWCIVPYYHTMLQVILSRCLSEVPYLLPTRSMVLYPVLPVSQLGSVLGGRFFSRLSLFLRCGYLHAR